MKIRLSKNARTELAKHAEAIRAKLLEMASINSQLTGLIEQQEKLSIKRAKLESARPGDAKAAREMTVVKAQIESVSQAIQAAQEKANREFPPGDPNGLGSLVRQAGYAFGRVLKPLFEDEERQAAKLLRPLCDNDELSLILARQTSRVKSLGAVIFSPRGSGLVAGREMLSRLTDAVNGELLFTFNPNL